MIGLRHHLIPTKKLIPKCSSRYCKQVYHASRTVKGESLIEHQKTEVPIFLSRKKKKDDKIRALILEILNTTPSQREAQSYLKRFKIPLKPPKPPTFASVEVKIEPSILEKDVKPQTQELQEPKESQESQVSRELQESHSTILRTSTELVDSLLETKFEHVALIKTQGPFDSRDLKYVTNALIRLQNLGLMPIVILDNVEWREMLKEGPPRFNELIQWMKEDITNFCEELENAGGRATPIYNGIFKFKEGDNKDNNHSNHKSYTLSDDKIDVSLSSLNSYLKLGHIPLILPVASDGYSKQKTIHPDSAMISLSRSLSDACLNLKTSDLEPMKIMVINSEGGIPSEERKGSHVFINIQQEYEDIKKSYKDNPEWKITHPTSLENFEMIKTCLERLPSTSSAIMVPAHSPKGLIYNLITDKPLFSSSLPLMAPTTPSTATTVIRYGMQVHYHNTLSTIDIPSLNSLIEASFEKKLDTENFIERLKKNLDLVIVTGDYQGAAIVTLEGKGKGGDGVPYLDKFAVSPKNQGTGIADILWKQLQIRYPNLMWRSRCNNGVNKWYFERSDGNLRISGSHWMMFWYGKEGINKLKAYTETAKNIPPSLISC